MAHGFNLACGLALGLALVACGSSTPEATEPTSDTASDGGGRGSSGLGIEAEIGALNERDVMRAFNGSVDGMMKCFQRGIDRTPFLGGVVRIAVRVPAEGKVRAYMKSSTLGDRETEACMLGVVQNRDWPAPVGGKEGLAENEFTFDPQEGTREPVAWSSGDAGKNVDKAIDTLRGCRHTAKSGRLSATLYVETDGSVKSVGVSGEDANVEQAADCVVRAMKDMKFNSPGSFAAKLTLSE
ncbi:MAG: hypothetical protein HOW73_06535 [Polyangiaceae bacterium]|nr:hypothetical protein [Polyangiaceae bacterium]